MPKACSILFALLAAAALRANAQSRDEFRAIMEQAMRKEAEAVRDEYSTKPMRVKLGQHRYVIPVNYFGPKGRREPDSFDADQAGYFGFRLFLPGYGGYTTENWRDKFDEHLVTVVRLWIPDKNRTGIFPNGEPAPANPAGYYEPKATFRNWRPMLELNPSLHYYGLDGYRPKHGRAEVTWTGTRSNGEFFFFKCHLAPGDTPETGTYPFCDVRYYSEKEDLVIVYWFANANLPKWREIDDAIWAKLHEWEALAK